MAECARTEPRYLPFKDAVWEGRGEPLNNRMTECARTAPRYLPFKDAVLGSRGALSSASNSACAFPSSAVSFFLYSRQCPPNPPRSYRSAIIINTFHRNSSEDCIYL
eukprot:1194597-Prorocentrum_minimum.AAC.2